MEIKNRYIVFDTNMWLKILSKTPEIDRKLLSDLQKQNQFAMYNMSIIEILMRFSRKNNIKKIREILEYITLNVENGNLIIGNIFCPNFYIKDDYILELNSKSDDEIILKIEELKKSRFEFKSSIIALWILILFELSCPAFANNYEHADQIVLCCESKSTKIKNAFIEYFYLIEGNNKKVKNLRSITNKIYKDMLDEIAKETNIVDNDLYKSFQNEINKLDDTQSISYLYKGFYNSKAMASFKYRIIRTLDFYFNSENFKNIFFERLNAFMQGECLEKNDVEDMLMMSVMEFDNNIILVTDDEKMKNFLEQKEEYKIGNKIHNILLKK